MRGLEAYAFLGNDKRPIDSHDPVEATLHAEHQFDLYKAWLSPSKLKFNDC